MRRFILLFFLIAPPAAHAGIPGFLTEKHFGQEELPISSVLHATGQYDRHNTPIITDIALAHAALSEGRAICYFAHESFTPELCHTQEQQARTHKKGLWQNIPELATLDLEEKLDDYRGHFVVVHGIVHDISETKMRTYINLGDDWKTDTTFIISAENRPLFAEDISALTGKKIEVRGWVERYNGPLIKLNHPMQWHIVKPYP